MVDFGFGPFLALDSHTTQLALLGHVAVAGVEEGAIASDLAHLAQLSSSEAISHGIDGYIESLLAKSGHWREVIINYGNRLNNQQRTLIAISLSTYDLVTQDVPATGGTRQRRIDAVLDLLDVPCCGWDLLDIVSDAVSNLVGTEQSDDRLRETLRSIRPIAEILGGIHPYVGIPAAMAISHFGQERTATESPKIPAYVVTLARVIVACSKRPGGSSSRGIAREARAVVLSHMQQTASKAAAIGCDVAALDDGRFDHLHHAGTALAEIAGTVVGVHELPSLMGLRVPEARKIVDVGGLKLSVIDGRGKTDSRSPDSRWIVTTAPATVTGTTVHLTALPNSEAPPGEPDPLKKEAGPGSPDARDCAFPGNASRATLDKYWLRLRNLLPRDSRVVWFAGAMNLNALATEDSLYLFSESDVSEHGKFTHSIPFDKVTSVEIGKDWFDWFVRVHRVGRSSVKFNLGSNANLAKRLQTDIETAAKRACNASARRSSV